MYAYRASLALLALACSSPVLAQPSAAGQQVLEEIIVTAQRRAERVQDVPISMTVLNPDDLSRAGVDGFRDLALVTPGLTIQAQGNFVQPALRGVTTLVTGPGVDNPIALYIDGVYEGSQSASSIDLPDIERIEVLKGPQGTLFGRNATGGAIQIFTRAPDFTPAVHLSATAGMFDGAGSSRSARDLRVKGFLSMPLVDDRVAASISFSHQDINGYSTNVAHGAVSPAVDAAFGGSRLDYLESSVLRGKLLMTPTDRIQLMWTAYYSKRETDHGSIGLPVDGLTSANVFPDAIFGTEPWQYAFDSPHPVTAVRRRGISLKADFDFDLGTLTSTTSYAESRYKERVDVDAAFSPACLAAFSCIAFEDTQPNDDFSQEFLFASETMGRWSFIAGANLFDSSGELPAAINDFTGGALPGAPGVVNPPLFVANTKVDTRAYGIFGEANYDLTDALTIIAGLRYSQEKKKGKVSFFGAPLDAFASPSWSEWTPRLSLKYALDDRSNVYFTYSRGFKSGVLPLWDTTPPADPEKLTAYEVGYKTQRDGVALNVAAFYLDYKNLQVQSFTGTRVLITNAASARIYGLEVDGSVSLTPELSLKGGLSWIPEAEYRAFDTATAFGPPQAPTGHLTMVAPLDASGTRLLRTPKVTASTSLVYATRLRGGELTMAPSLYYSSSYLPYDPLRVVTQSSYVKLAGEVSYVPDGSPFRIVAWGRNLTNSKSISSSTVSANAARVSYDRPRSFGVTFEYEM
ncbi:MAG: TonB-dependent receptor [Gammaproteobacteria bacterium]|nr:TonB-dependent receptor [Gammaproteobacteria bacterium]